MKSGKILRVNLQYGTAIALQDYLVKPLNAYLHSSKVLKEFVIKVTFVNGVVNIDQ